MTAPENPPSRIRVPDRDELAAKTNPETNMLAKLIENERKRKNAGLDPEGSQAASGDTSRGVRDSLEQTSRLINHRNTPQGPLER